MTLRDFVAILCAAGAIIRANRSNDLLAVIYPNPWSANNHGGKQEVADHQKVYAQAAKMVTSPKMAAFDLNKEPQKSRDAYGTSAFAQGCLLARRLIESGVTFVECEGVRV